jgi:hypothetical protein
MSLTDFLLARIAEDEVWLHASQRQISVPSSPPQDPARMLTDCKAKRRIVEAFRLRQEQGVMPRGEVFGYHATGLAIAIRCLAEVYADHPDYRAEWIQ